MYLNLINPVKSNKLLVVRSHTPPPSRNLGSFGSFGSCGLVLARSARTDWFGLVRLDYYKGDAWVKYNGWVKGVKNIVVHYIGMLYIASPISVKRRTNYLM